MYLHIVSQNTGNPYCHCFTMQYHLRHNSNCDSMKDQIWVKINYTIPNSSVNHNEMNAIRHMKYAGYTCLRNLCNTGWHYKGCMRTYRARGYVGRCNTLRVSEIWLHESKRSMLWLVLSHSWTKELTNLAMGAVTVLRHHPTYPLKIFTTLLLYLNQGEVHVNKMQLALSGFHWPKKQKKNYIWFGKTINIPAFEKCM